MKNIIALDGYSINPGDLSWDALKSLGMVYIFDRTEPEEVIDRARNAQILVVNKTILDANVLHQLTDLECICVTATGFNNVDIQVAKKRKIPVCNIRNYSTYSVAQQVFAYILHFTNQVQKHHESVAGGMWNRAPEFSYFLNPLTELKDKVLGIYGLGNIGRQVAKIGMSFGMHILATHKYPERDKIPGVTFVSLENLFKESDFISLHAPLNKGNQGIVDQTLLRLMKSSAYLINTARGGLIHEADLRLALDNGQIAGAGIDVISIEPPKDGNILFEAKNCIITPHNAWATQEARQRLLDMLIDNIKAFLAGSPQNVVNPAA